MRLAKKFTVYRSKWLRGEGGNPSMLYRPTDGKMCCMGMLCEQSGIPIEELDRIGDLDGLTVEIDRADDFDCVYNPNDDPHIDDTTREAILTERFASLGVEVKFV